jgi:hypothetical protein
MGRVQIQVVAKESVKRILSGLQDRSGIKQAFYDLDEEILAEIESEMEKVIADTFIEFNVVRH